MTRLGTNQMRLLKAMGHVGCAIVVPDKLTRSLIRRGLMEPTGDQPGAEGSFAVLTAAGFRAIADAIDAGRIAHRPDWAAIRANRSASQP